MFVVTDGFRQRKSFLAPAMWGGYAFHAGFAALGMWLLLRAAGA